jgi:hypothetical protein
MDLTNVGILPQRYTASQLRRPRLETVKFSEVNSNKIDSSLNFIVVSKSILIFKNFRMG